MSKFSNIKFFCASNGEGVRTAVYFSGCRLHCKGCFNYEAWDFDAGKEFTDAVIKKIVKSVEPDHISGISILGGEPLDERNQEAVERLVKAVKDTYGDAKTVWLWTGYTYETIPETPYKKNILQNVDVMIDGPFDIEKSPTELKFRGSSNQRMLKKINGKFVCVD